MVSVLLKSRSTKGKDWAKAFTITKERANWSIKDVDEALMTSWFANAIEVAKSVTKTKQQRLLNKANEMLKVQEQSYDYDPYMHGLYNGMEFVLCLLEERDPQFKEAPVVWGVNKPSTLEFGIAQVSVERKEDCPGDCNMGIPCQICGSNGQYIGRVKAQK